MNNIKIGVVGLGYVGLPLAVEFDKKYPTIGFDINQQRITELQAGIDRTLETSNEELADATHLTYTTAADNQVYNVTVGDSTTLNDLFALIRAGL